MKASAHVRSHQQISHLARAVSGTDRVFCWPLVKARRLILLLTVYVTLDLSSPFIPGAFNFNPDESVDGVHRQRDPRTPRPVIAGAPRVLPVTLPTSATLSAHAVAGGRRESNSVNEWLVDVRRAHAPVPEVSALSEDH
jgi:hypothetical protein